MDHRTAATPARHHHDHGNGVRVHAILFLAVSLTGLLVILAAVAISTTR